MSVSLCDIAVVNSSLQAPAVNRQGDNATNHEGRKMPAEEGSVPCPSTS
jgi:hypothetical protein